MLFLIVVVIAFFVYFHLVDRDYFEFVIFVQLDYVLVVIGLHEFRLVILFLRS